MITITLKDGSSKQYEAGTAVIDVAQDISAGLARAACAAEVDGQLVDLRYRLQQDCALSLLTFDDPGGRHAYWHTSSHIMAQAVQRLYPSVQLAIGPAIDTGFYYDFDVDAPFTREHLEAVEKEMQAIIKENLPIERFSLTREEALQWADREGGPYKRELIEEFPEAEEISFYRQGDFTDLCAGPHLMSTGRVKAFKLLYAAGAYWRGDEHQPMLQRIYGTAFPKKSLLDDHLQKLEEARQRDHNKLGRELELFMTSEVVGQGLPLLMPKGAKVMQILQRFVEDEEERRGYLATRTPVMAKRDLYEVSGHWTHYKDGMFIMGNEEAGEDVLALRPMTCPFQFQIYKSKLRSYRDLPLRYSETSPLFRNESSGEMHGLIRVRQFTISEGHLICTPEQLQDEFLGVMDLIDYVMDTLGLREDIWFRFSKWDPDKKDKYIDNPEAWEFTQDQMKRILDAMELEYVEAEDEAAFYGPKLDIQTRNVHGKEDTIITVQIDFALPERFDMTYVDKDGERKRPIIIHRTSIGCYERTLAMLIEKYAGAFPLWLAPVQARILPIAEKHAAYAQQLQRDMQQRGLRVEADLRNEKIGYKIREAQMQKIPYMLVVGDKEVDNEAAAVRSRKEGDLGPRPIKKLLPELLEEAASRKF